MATVINAVNPKTYPISLSMSLSLLYFPVPINTKTVTIAAVINKNITYLAISFQAITLVYYNSIFRVDYITVVMKLNSIYCLKR